ncbi:nitric oxide reductase NorE protein [Chitinivorax tropicus]|uniref:Nitric oxide reductase NorE protein n=1 Tax=Chitinivorax tropicus TaxID=714531 RepID=A0A840MLZ2_9PROT|nr:cytochrome c oxidase subunit 3 family protein [Chitinivorax tropicus]MBB5018149.1 nitric oxide reductase NorE protein [Chitinivorax tropicus]
MWFFILAELLVFGLFFVAYAVTRAKHRDLFATMQATLDTTSGAINTALLLTGSYLVVRAVQAIQLGRGRHCAQWLVAGWGCGAVFVMIKLAEFADKLGAGVTLSSNVFYMFYLSLTFFHFLHVLLGMVILAACAWKAWQGGYSQADHAGVETGAAYWHMVDLVWVVLFPLVYVMR